jgi:transcription initiation factor TFIIB
LLLSNYSDIGSCCAQRDILFDTGTNEYICCGCGVIVGYNHDIESDLDIINHLGANGGSGNNIKAIINSSRQSLDWSTLGVNSSVIGRRNVDYMNKPIDYQMAYLLRRNDLICVNKNEYNRQHHIKSAKQTIVSLSQKLFIPRHVADRAARLYDTAYTKKLIKGRNIEGISAAALYISCREEGIIKHLSEFAAIMYTKTLPKKRDKYKNKNLNEKYLANRSKKRIQKQLFEAYQLLVRELDLKPGIKEPNLPAEINRIGSVIGTEESSIREAIRLSDELRKFDKTIYLGKSPPAIAACILYIATKFMGENIKQIVITRTSGISTVTLRKHCSQYVILLKKNGYTIPTDLETFLIQKY